MLDPVLKGELAAAFGAAVTAARPLAGGCISPVLQVSFADGAERCVKLAPAGADGAGMLRAEAAGLRALRAAAAVRVPSVEASAARWLALEWLPPGRADAGAWAALGTALAELHARTAGASYGWTEDNYIGSLPQRNEPAADWPEFWRERRLGPQLERAERHLDARTCRDFETLCARLPELLAPAHAEGSSLLHGDLWSGNVHAVADRSTALIDPSCYRGHREVDLAMAALFGGFEAPFWHAYEQRWPLVRTGFECRRAVYQLYYLLVHVNLFGAAYVPRTRAALAASLSPRSRPAPGPQR